ncbi:MAG: hypothetical protein LBP32_00060, partial [Spirochaetaceae bacterium]|nr:hypothetical protein [Spirochaetaceae bacterium]
MIGVRDELIGRAEEYLGRTIEYASIGPSIFGTLDIRDIRIHAGDSAPVVTIARFRLSYSLRELIRGNREALVRSVRVDNPRFNLDLERDADLLDLLSSFSGTNRREIGFFPENLFLRVRGGAVSVLTGGNRFDLTGLTFDAAIGEDRMSFRGRWNGGASLAGFVTQTLSLSCRIDGELATDLRDGSLTVSFPFLAGDMFLFRAVTARLTLADKRVELRKINDRAPFDLYLGYDLEDRRLTGTFRAEKFRLREILTLDGSWRAYDPWFAAEISGLASLVMDDRGTRYEVDLSGALPQGGTYAVSGQGNERLATFKTLSFQLPQGNFRFTGSVGFKPLSPNGSVVISGLSLSGDGTVNGEFTVSTEGREVNLFGENVSVGDVSFSVLDAGLLWEDRGFTFALSALRFRNIESYEDVRPSSLTLNGSYDSSPRNVQASLEVDSFSVEDMAGLARPFTKTPGQAGAAVGLAGDVWVTAEVFVTTDFEHILYNAPRVVLAGEGEGDMVILISLAGTDQRFELTQGRVFWNGGAAEVLGYTDFSDPMDISFSFRMSYRELSYYLEGMILDRRSLSIQGSYGLYAYVDADGAGYSGYIEAEAIPIPIRGQFAQLSLLASLRYDSPDSWSADLNRFEITGPPAPGSPLTTLGLAGKADQDGVLLSRFYYDDGGGALSGGVSVFWDRDFSSVRGNAFLSGQGDDERYHLSGSYNGELLDIRLSVSEIRLSRILRNSNNAVMTGDIRLLWRSWESYSVDLILSSLSTGIGEIGLNVSATGSMNERTLVMRDTRVDYGGLKVEIPLFRVDIGDSHGEFLARL